MKKSIFGIMACGVCLMLVTGCSSEEKEPTLPKFEMSPVENIIAEKQTASQLEMIADVVSTLKDDVNDQPNLIFSPLNVSMALSVLANATDDNTASILSNIAGCTDLNDLNKFNAHLIEYLPIQPKDNILDIANGVWYNNDLEINPSFVNITSSFYNCLPDKMDFGAPNACEIINDWVSNKTHGLINNIVDDGVINSITEMFIVSTLYYKGTWLSPFDSKKTTDKIFHGSKGDTNIPTMCKLASMDYAKTADGTQIVELPFKSENIVLSVLLPAEGVDVMDYASEFDSQKMKIMEDLIESKMVNLYLPKFTVKDKKILNQYLSDKGIDCSKFSIERACDKVNLFLNIQHQTHFEIDEDGVKLAAVTNIGVDSSTGPTEPIEFTVDRPFIFLVKVKSTGSILMAGIIRNLN